MLQKRQQAPKWAGRCQTTTMVKGTLFGLEDVINGAIRRSASENLTGAAVRDGLLSLSCPLKTWARFR